MTGCDYALEQVGHKDAHCGAGQWQFVAISVIAHEWRAR